MRFFLLLLLPLSFDFSVFFPNIEASWATPIIKACSKALEPPTSRSYDYSPPTKNISDSTANPSKESEYTELTYEDISKNRYKPYYQESVIKYSNSQEWLPLKNENIEIKNYKSRHMYMYFDEHDYLFYPTENPVLFNFMPRSSNTYKNIYGRKIVPQTAIDMLAKFNLNLSKRENINNLDIGFNDFEDHLKLEDDRLIIIFAHSEGKGKNIVFPNGDKVHESKIHDACEYNQKICVILTCHGEDFDIKGIITVDDALKMWDSAFNLHSEKKIMNIDFIYEMRIRRKNMEKESRTRIYISVTGATGTSSLAYYYSSEQK